MERRAQILTAAAAEFDRVGFAGATIAGIARGAGVSQGTLHFHFPTKLALALGVIDEQNVRTFDVVSHTDASPTAALVRASHGIATLLRTDPVVRAGIRMSLERGEFRAATVSFYEQWIAGIVDVFRLAIASGELRTDLSAEELGATVVPFFTGVQLVSDVRTGRADLFPAVATMWRVVLAATADAAHRERLLGVVADLFGVVADPFGVVPDPFGVVPDPFDGS
ncbi:ScbR family autoregulator-binding transcription factor [Curtobacterium sp. MCLR17_036]|uniref:ScbR family autoregulator-binding transcription factor n=1 Tax=Curtobacterium sp. MCLR17_036 TaxID=2175620 RepID=UPI0015E8E88F|nr:ScbR family autoregulator-binding transcription factor [Curtobacterium sp. MCLR17_036]WIE64189.1 ScbR family autoregulator-binding transcription factor [Curtobacterium sp. MCLR17_036]